MPYHRPIPGTRGSLLKYTPAPFVRRRALLLGIVTALTVQIAIFFAISPSARQLTSDLTTSIESKQSTSTGNHYVEITTGLTDDTEYTVRVIVVNSIGASDPSGDATGTPRSRAAYECCNHWRWERGVYRILAGARPGRRIADRGLQDSVPFPAYPDLFFTQEFFIWDQVEREELEISAVAVQDRQITLTLSQAVSASGQLHSKAVLPNQ